MKATINSEKHYVQFPVQSTTSGTRDNLELIDVDNQLTNVNDVRVGAIVKAVYVELWADSDTASITGVFTIQKQPSDVQSPTFTEMQNLSTYPNKKNILITHQGLMPSSGNIIPIFREWILIPKGKQRFGLGDRIQVTIAAVGATIKVCGFCLFKEYY